MSKSMAIEGVMKIFLMIAVIIVGMSFLLKAFGIDIFGWLQDKLQGFGGPSDGWVLHVKIDPGDNPIEVWEFWVSSGVKSGEFEKAFGEGTNLNVILSDKPSADHEGKYFSLSNLPSDKCVIFVTDEEGGDEDEGMIYEVKHGTRVQSEIDTRDTRSCDGKSLEECIGTANIASRTCKWVTRNGDDRVKCVENNCVLKGQWINGQKQFFNQGRQRGIENTLCHNYQNYLDCSPHDEQVTDTNFGVRCDVNEDVIKKGKFGLGVFNGDGCLKDSKKCNLLGGSKDDLEKLNKDRVYRVKFGVICDSQNKWKVCKPADSKGNLITDTVTVGTTTYTCDKSSDNYVWIISPESQIPLCSFQGPCTSGKTMDICTGECKDSSTCTFQGPCQGGLTMNPCTGQCVRVQ